MPRLIFPNGAIASAATANIASIKIKKDIGNSAITTTNVASIGAVSRKRSLSPMTASVASGLSGTLKRKLKLPSGSIISSIITDVRFFLAADQSPPPVGKLTTASSRFGGSRLVKGDLIPLSFAVTGHKLAGLNAVFTAKRKDNLLAAPLIKAGIHETDPVLDPQTGVETMNGTFSIESADTDGFPDTEVELHYNFKLEDGLGRVYTLESGNFTVYSADG